MAQKPGTDELSADFQREGQEPFLNRNPHWITSLSLLPEEDNGGSHRAELLRCTDDGEGVLTEDDHPALSNDGLSDFSNSDISLSEVCITSNTKDFVEEMNYEVQQAYRIFSEFLTEKHKLITSPFFHPVGNQETPYGIGGVRSRSQANVRQSMCLRRMEEKFMDKEYATITEFVADFRLMLENCYRYHGVDHWLSKQAQKLEIMLEQKLTLLSRKLREKTTLAVTSKGRFAVGEEHVSTSSTRRRQTPRCLKTLTVGGHESIMVQTLRLEEQQKAKEEKRQRELEKKEAEEMSAKEMDEWEKNLLSQASPHNVETLWELPAIGHFLCLAQTALNLPEIVFYELERCMLMPRCSILLSKIMSSLLCPPQRRSTLHRRPVMPYRRWESELRQRVKNWYQAVGASHDQTAQAEQLGLCYQFFSVLGEISPLEGKAFHMLPFYQRVWLLKGLCDHVYETQRDVQDAVLAQPIHECRESILGYDSKENAYIHFPHFCGADLRIYCQSPCASPTFPFTSVLVKKVQIFAKLKEDIDSEVNEVSGSSQDDKSLKTEMYVQSKIGNDEFGEESTGRFSCKARNDSPLESNEETGSDESRVNGDTNAAQITSPFRKRILITKMEENKTDYEFNSKRLKEEKETNCSLSLKNERVIKEHCLSIGEHCYTGRSPAGSVTVSALQKIGITTMSTKQEDQKPSCCKNKINSVKLEQHQCSCGCFGLSTQLDSKHTDTSCEERVNDTTLTMVKEQRKKKGKTLFSGVKSKPNWLRRRSSDPESKPSVQSRSVAIKRKDERKKHIQGKALNHLKNIHEHSQPSFKLVCSNLDDLRELINKTEDELDDLESTKKRLNRWYNRREAVKDLHSTLIRLLNELTPWEPKLIKAYQRNRLRLKKEFEVFKNHPEYNNFVREECISSLSDDGDLSLLLEQFRQSGHEDPEHILPRGLGGSLKETSTELATESLVTYTSYNHQKRPLSTTSDNLDLSDFPKTSCKSEPSQCSAEPRFSTSSFSPSLQFHTVPSKPNSIYTVSRKPNNYSPIPTLLAKSVGNKVTLMKQPAYPLEINILNPDCGKTGNCCPSDSPQNSQQKHSQNSEQSPKRPVSNNAGLSFPVLFKNADSLKESTQAFHIGHMAAADNSSNTNRRSEEVRPQQVVILPSNIILHKTDEAKFSQQSKDIVKCNSKMDTMFLSTNSSGFPISENRLLIHQVPTTENIDQTDKTSSFCDILGFPKSQQSNVNVARSKGTQHCGVQTSTSQYKPNFTAVTSAPSGFSLSTNSKQELKTVCIRESQSILVTTRGGNTGIVKVQKSSDNPACLSKSSVITISPQFQAYLVPKTAPLLSSDAPSLSDATLAATTGPIQTQKSVPPLKSNAKVTTCTKTTSISLSQEVSQSLSAVKCQALMDLSSYTSANLSKKATPESCQASLKNVVPSLSNFVASPNLTAVDVINKPHSDIISEDGKSQSDKLILISHSSHDVNVCCTKTLPTSVTLPSSPTAKTSLPVQDSNTTLKQATISGPVQQVIKTPSTQMFCQTWTSTNTVSPTKDKAVFVSSGISTDTSVSVPYMVATTIAQNTVVQQQSSKCRGAEPMMSITAQPVFINSNVIPRGITIPASSLSSLKPFDISSITKISQPGNVMCPSTNLVSAANFKKTQGLSTLMISSSSNPVASKPTSTPPTQNKSLNSQIVTDISSGLNKTTLSPSLSFTKPQVSSTVPESSEIIQGKGPSTNTPAGTVQQQIVISTSVPLPGGARIVLNNAHFMVPPQGLSPGSHVFVISGSTPQHMPAKSTKEPPFQKLNQVPVVHSTARLACVPAVRSFVPCTAAVAPSLQATTSIVTTDRLTGPDNTAVSNKTKAIVKCPSLQTVNIDRTTKGASTTSTFPIIGSVLPQASTVLTSVSSAVSTFRQVCSTNTTTSLAFSLPSVLPPLSVLQKPPTVLIPPFKADSEKTSCSQDVLSLTQDSALAPSQHSTSITSISCSSSTALMHMGHSSLVVQKQEPTVVQVLGSVRTMNNETAPSSNNGAHVPAPQSLPCTTQCPVIVTPPAMEKHLIQTSFLKMHSPLASKLLISPDGAVLSTVQCKIKSTKEQLDV